MSDIPKMIAIAKKFGGGNAGGGVFVVNAETDDTGEGESFSATIDKTFAEIEEAHNSGQAVQMRFTAMGMQVILPLTVYFKGELASFNSVVYDTIMGIDVSSAGSVEGVNMKLSTQG